jgi:hypothetical protein
VILWIGVFLAVSGCSVQPEPGYFAPPVEDVVWRAGTDEGKRLRAELFPDFVIFIDEVRGSEALSCLGLHENAIGVVRFEESGRKCGLEFSFRTPPSFRTGYDGSIADLTAGYVAPLAALVARHPALVGSDALDCFVFEFLWPTLGPGGTYSQAYKEPIQAINPKTGAVRSFPAGPVSPGAIGGSGGWDGVSVEIPRIIVKKLADSEIEAADLTEYVRQAGARKRM